ncbi:MAG2-interacting protein 2 [Melia azedarach]|uniref:MAG2-interacting protein 2 n=1 Tax=Melia azedarach TaxID=155640 RepID=A0ACC1XMD5_MELAZ|nr:MAG2-interacting protein 2 [Melia azedarach]
MSLSLFFPLYDEGVSKFKEKWSRYRQLRKIKKRLSLFISPRGEHVAMAVGNQIIVSRRMMTSTNLAAFLLIPKPMNFFVEAHSDGNGVKQILRLILSLFDNSLANKRPNEEDISAVEEAIAREAAVAVDLQLGFDLCLVLVKNGHGPIWDLSAAIQGPALKIWM